MSILARMASIAALSAALGGCVGLSNPEPYPVYGNRVNPTPVPGYKVQCRSEPGAAYALFHHYLSACEQVIPPADERVLRARG